MYIGLPSFRLSAPGSLSAVIAAMFSNSEQGWWYDTTPDFAGLYQDSTGTTPVTAVEQPVGLQLDKRYGLVRGGELLTNGGFAGGGSGWTPSANTTVGTTSVSFAADAMRYVTAGADFIGVSQAVLTVGKWYEVTIVLKTGSSGTLKVTGLGAGGEINFSCAAETRVLSGLATATTFSIARVSGTAADATIDSVSVREIPGNHRLQATSASRPTLSARYNLLTKTEKLDDPSAWTLTGATATVTGFIEDTSTNQHSHNTVGIPTAGISYRVQVKVRRTAGVSTRYFKLAGAGLGAVNEAIVFDLSGAGTVYMPGASTYAKSATVTATSVPGQYLVQATIVAASSSAGWGFASTNATTDHGSATFAGDGVTAFELLEPDVRLSTDVTGKGPAYQHVNTSTDYDTNGFLHYLKYDGVDDSLATASTVDFSATDKVTVFAGVTKLSDAARGMLMELGATYANAGTFGIEAPYAAGVAGYLAAVNGSGVASLPVTSVAAPITNVLTVLLDIAGATAAAEVNVRNNGTSVSSGHSGSAGTGNFSNATAYFGRRAGSTLPFNGREYSNICVGRTAITPDIQNGERYVNSLTGAY